MRKYPDTVDKLQYISYKVNQLTSAEKEELRAFGKELPLTSMIQDSDDEEDDET